MNTYVLVSETIIGMLQEEEWEPKKKAASCMVFTEISIIYKNVGTALD